MVRYRCVWMDEWVSLWSTLNKRVAYMHAQYLNVFFVTQMHSKSNLAITNLCRLFKLLQLSAFKQQPASFYVECFKRTSPISCEQLWALLFSVQRACSGALIVASCGQLDAAVSGRRALRQRSALLLPPETCWSHLDHDSTARWPVDRANDQG